MTAEILCIGTELLLGNITNGNARWIAEQLAALGIAHHRQAVVGDNRERLIAELQAAAQRCQVLITTGGLGPTPDDLTTEAIAAAFGAPLVEHPQVWAEIQARLAARGRPWSPPLPGVAMNPAPLTPAPGIALTLAPRPTPTPAPRSKQNLCIAQHPYPCTARHPYPSTARHPCHCTAQEIGRGPELGLRGLRRAP